MPLLEDFFDYYEYNVKTLNMAEIPKEFINKFHKWNESHDTVYSGSERDRHIGEIKDWTTDLYTASRFAGKDGFIVTISKEGFIKRFNFISMDVVFDYLVKGIKSEEESARLYDYISESELYAFELKEYTVENEL